MASGGAYNAKRVAYRAKVRADVLAKYGNRCACCDEDRRQFLCIDHIHGNGKADRLKHGVGYAFYLHLYRNDPMPGYRVLCHNCNMALGFYGFCPHDADLVTNP